MFGTTKNNNTAVCATKTSITPYSYAVIPYLLNSTTPIIFNVCMPQTFPPPQKMPLDFLYILY